MPNAAADLPQVTLEPPDTYRLTASKLPPIDLYEQVVGPEEFVALYALEAETSARLDERLWPIAMQPEDAVFGAGSVPIMAPFCYGHPKGSRFSDGQFGVYYAGLDEQTALHESAYHFRRFAMASGRRRQTITKRVYRCALIQPVRDGRQALLDSPEMDPDPDHYAAGQAFGAACRAMGAWGLAYPSARRSGGDCVAVFWPKALQPPAMQTRHYELTLDNGQVSARVVGESQQLQL